MEGYEEGLQSPPTVARPRCETLVPLLVLGLSCVT